MDSLFAPSERSQIPLSEWLDRVAKLAGYSDGQALVAVTGTCCWMDYYTDGQTPGEAWSEECSYG